jgi:hypothetical protein
LRSSIKEQTGENTAAPVAIFSPVYIVAVASISVLINSEAPVPLFIKFISQSYAIHYGKARAIAFAAANCCICVNLTLYHPYR